MQTILIIDDDDNLRESFKKLLIDEGYKVKSAASGEAGLSIVRESLPDTVIIDIRMPGIGGLETYRIIREIEPRLPVIIMTAFGTTDSAIEAIKMGAFDYVLKPFDIPEFLEVISKALETGRFMRSPVRMNLSGGSLSEKGIGEGDSMIGKSPAIQTVYKSIGRVAPSDASVLIRGESGTGKELVARAVYQYSNRSEKPFMIINCVAIPETLLESELFGYEKGAFTGAVSRKIGKIEQANGGTVFLDEIGDIPLGLQSKFLRLLQEKSIERIGGRETIPVDVRIIAATNRKLEDAIKAGTFREDLYFRLKVVTITIPPLRERTGDVPILTEYFMAKHAYDNMSINPGITKAALNALTLYAWPGNVRELSNVIQKMLLYNRGLPIDIDEFISNMLPEENTSGQSRGDAEEEILCWIRHQLENDKTENLFDRSIDKFAALFVAEALKISGGNRTKAAKMLGISRPTLHARISKHNIEILASVQKRSDN
jgi:two-component system nitrogen regulation response regulator GlnG